MNKLQFLFKDKLKTTSLIISIIIIIAAIADLYRPIIYPGKVLPGQIGRIEGGRRVAESGKDKEGFLTYGPYAHLEPGRYKIQLEYGAMSAESGSWDIIYTGEPHWIIGENLPLRENGLISHKITVSKEDSWKTLEIRTKYSGKGTLKVSKIVIKKRIPTNAILIRSFIGGIIAFLFYVVSLKWMPLIIEYLNIGLNSTIRSLRSVITRIMSQLLSGLTRESKIRYLLTIVLIGFMASVTFHYLQAMFYNKGVPINTFLPPASMRFCDFYGLFDAWARLSFNGITYGLSYFPSTYLIVDLFWKLREPYIALIPFLGIFIFFFMIYAYKNLQSESILDTVQRVVIVSFMTYPVLFSLHSGNIENFLFIFLCLFIYFYQQGKTKLSALFLAMPISMKLMPAVFLILLLSDKKYREILYTLLYVFILSLIPLLIFDGGIRSGLGNYLNNLMASQKMYAELMIIGGGWKPLWS